MYTRHVLGGLTILYVYIHYIINKKNTAEIQCYIQHHKVIIVYYKCMNCCVFIATTNSYRLASKSTDRKNNHSKIQLSFIATYILTELLLTLSSLFLFAITENYSLLSRVRNKPYDVFGCWLNETHLISGNLHWIGNMTSCSVLWLNKAFQVSPSTVAKAHQACQ